MKKRNVLILGITALAIAIALVSFTDTTSPAKSESESPRSEGLPLEYSAGPYQFGVSIQPAIPVVGKNTLILDIRDKSSKAVSGASVKAVAEMPAMGSMPAMQAPAEMNEIRPGIYRGVFEPWMKGSWPLTINISDENLGSARVNFDLATGRKGLQLSSGALRKSGSARREELPAGTVTLDPSRRQLIGLKTSRAHYRELTRSIRAVGTVEYDAAGLTDISLKVDAWIGTLHADSMGKYVAKGGPLFTIYSPDLYSAQQEFLELAKRSNAPRGLLESARKRLGLWGMAPAEITDLARRGEPLDYVTIRAPRSGVVVAKNIVEGTSHRAGMTLLRLADLSEVWVEADVYESDLPYLETGMAATIIMPHAHNTGTIKATVSFIYPFFDNATRTAKVRMQVDNPQGKLKPGMYAEVHLKTPMGERLAVPEEALIVSGQKRFVFEDIGEGRLAPRRVEVGARAEGYVEITKGLEDGDRIVTSGNFLIASESRLKAGLEQW